MTEAILLVLTDLWHLAGTLALFLIVGTLTAPIVFGWYHVEKTREEQEK